MSSYTRNGKYTNAEARIDNKIVIITGANTGLGKATAVDLAKRGGKIYMACRSEERGIAALKEVQEASGSQNLLFMQLDLADLDSVRNFSSKFHEKETRLDILINNAGLLSPMERTKDGFEINMGVNHLGHFLLTNLLLDLLKQASPSRIVVVSSQIHSWGNIKKDDFNSEKSFQGTFKAYGSSKLANILFTRKLAKDLSGTGVTVNCLCPGGVNTEATRYLNVFMKWIFVPIKKLFHKTPEQGAQTQIMLAVEPALEKTTGGYFVDCIEKEPSAAAQDGELGEWLWKKSAEVTGLHRPTKAPLYVSKNDKFTCFDGKKTLKYSQLNDDFCDCADGSDEPGTSACPNGRFYCINSGFKALIIPATRVNDGICDCCDGSDEYFSNIKCISNCIELGSADKIREKQQAELLKSGNQIRIEMAQKGKKQKEEQKIRVAELEKARQQAEQVKEEKYKIKSEAEILENAALDVYRQADAEDKKQREELEAESNRFDAEETFRKFDSNSNGKIEVIELQTRIAFDKDRNGVVELEEARYFLDENDELELESFIALAWPRIKPFLMLDSGLFKPPRKDQDDETAEHRDEEDVEEAELQNEEDDHHTDDDTEYPEDEEAGEGEIQQEAPIEPQPQYDEETQKLILEANEARNQHSVADREFREIDRELSDIRGALEKDFGPEEEFAPLNGECFTYEDREYVYKLCPFDKAVQQPRNGGAETKLGTWDSWKGADYRHMLFANGAGCWNGPARSALVELQCGLDTRILGVSEPNRCEYQFNMQTPAACSMLNNGSEAHDEL